MPGDLVLTSGNAHPQLSREIADALGLRLAEAEKHGPHPAYPHTRAAAGPLQPDLWEAKSSWYAPSRNRANFLVTDSAPGYFNYWQPNPAALAALGRPARTYHVGPYTVYVYDKNLLADLG